MEAFHSCEPHGGYDYVAPTAGRTRHFQIEPRRYNARIVGNPEVIA